MLLKKHRNLTHLHRRNVEESEHKSSHTGIKARKQPLHMYNYIYEFDSELLGLANWWYMATCIWKSINQQFPFVNIHVPI